MYTFQFYLDGVLTATRQVSKADFQEKFAAAWKWDGSSSNGRKAYVWGPGIKRDHVKRLHSRAARLGLRGQAAGATANARPHWATTPKSDLILQGEV